MTQKRLPVPLRVTKLRFQVTEWAVEFFEEYVAVDASEVVQGIQFEDFSQINLLLFSEGVELLDEIFDFLRKHRPKQVVVVSDFSPGSDWCQRALKEFDCVGFVDDRVNWGKNLVLFYKDNGGGNGLSCTHFTSAFRKYGVAVKMQHGWIYET